MAGDYNNDKTFIHWNNKTVIPVVVLLLFLSIIAFYVGLLCFYGFSLIIASYIGCCASTVAQYNYILSRFSVLLRYLSIITSYPGCCSSTVSQNTFVITFYPSCCAFIVSQYNYILSRFLCFYCFSV